MKHAAMTVAADAVGSARQKTKMQMLLIGNSGPMGPMGGGKASAFQFWRWVILLMIIGCTLAAAMWGLLAGVGDFIRLQQGAFFFTRGGIIDGKETAVTEEELHCLGRRIYLYDMPPQFNTDLLETLCLERHAYLHMCDSYNNTGFGLKMEGVMDPVEAWYRTEQFGLEVILHEKLKKYECLTNNPDLADRFFLPYYVGLDLTPNLFTDQTQMADLMVERFLGWLLAQPTFVQNQGNNHFMALSRIVWDFMRVIDHPGWGNSLLNNFELQNVTKVTIERDPNSNDMKVMAVPYPTSFHPRSDTELQLWQKKVSEMERKNLASFAGAPRNSTEHPLLALRDMLFTQCSESEKCQTLSCNEVDCPKNPHFITNLFLSSKFCFQPPGDSPTRKAVFDCLVAGSIPVIFLPDTAYGQYLWHLPEDGSSYSVFIDEVDILVNHTNVIEILEQIPDEKVRQMQAVIHEEIIPKIVFDLTDGRDPSKKGMDAFDIILEHLFNPSYQAYSSSSKDLVQTEEQAP